MRRFILAPEAVRDLAQIGRHTGDESITETADRVEAMIRGKFAYLAKFPFAGHLRPDLTDAPVRFLAVYSFLIVYRPEAKPLQIISVLQGRRDVKRILSQWI